MRTQIKQSIIVSIAQWDLAANKVPDIFHSLLAPF